ARTLPIFCFEDEALLFLRLGGLEGRWRADETGAADLATNLASTPSGAYSMVRRVVLDPFPEVGFDGFRKAVSLPREMFVDLLANPRRPQVHSPNRPAATCSLPDSKGEYLPGAGFAPNCGRRSRKRAQ
ncbi:MAG: hypothetical protein H0V21_04195, partial [Rubrobacter sp.]|nr:hypothetical protein [Rubrobacter sp.]